MTSKQGVLEKNDTTATEYGDELEEGQFIRDKLFDDAKSPLERYMMLVVGRKSVFELLKYELLTLLFGWIPGALGIVLRRMFYSALFGRVGRGVVIGRNVTVRCGHNIELGNNVVIDDGCFLDGRGADEGKMRIGDHVILNRNCTVQSKVGPIHIGPHCSVGTGTLIAAQGGVFIGEWVGFAASCEVSGGLFQPRPEGDDAMPPYRRYSKGPVRIDKHCVVGFGAAILDGVHVGTGCMIGPGSIVLKDLPENSVISPRPGVILKRR